MGTATPLPGFTPTQTTKWVGQDWSNLVIFKARIPQADGTLEPSYTANTLSGPATYLGDAQGRITEVVAAPQGASHQLLPQELLQEVVTRNDGTQLSIAALLDALVTAAVQAPPAPVAPAPLP